MLCKTVSSGSCTDLTRRMMVEGRRRIRLGVATQALVLWSLGRNGSRMVWYDDSSKGSAKLHLGGAGGELTQVEPLGEKECRVDVGRQEEEERSR